MNLPRGEWLEPKEVAEKLCVCLSSVYSIIRNGQLKAYQFLPARKLVDSADLEEWMKKCEITAFAPNKPKQKEVMK
jgi:excisionase family DNA binding protein